MSKLPEQFIRLKCDRCPRKFELPASKLDGVGVFIDATGLGLGEINFEDLCPRCKKRVAALLALIKSFDTSEELTEQEASTAEPDMRAPLQQPNLHHPTEERQ